MLLKVHSTVAIVTRSTIKIAANFAEMQLQYQKCDKLAVNRYLCDKSTKKLIYKVHFLHTTIEVAKVLIVSVP